ncbi:hypothetical protein LDENG_00255570 [Lucifuga dentata]|nr:hypothetical protein LDENG_00255570 [Lucifuga dentata]
MDWLPVEHAREVDRGFAAPTLFEVSSFCNISYLRPTYSRKTCYVFLTAKWHISRRNATIKASSTRSVTPELALAEDANASPKTLPEDLENLRSVLLTDLTVTVTSLLDNALKPVSESLELIKQNIAAHANSIKAFETDLPARSDKVTQLETNYNELLSKCDMLTSKLDELENRSRRSNLRVLGVPEKMEGADPVEFMTQRFREICGSDTFPHPPLLDRAHRLGRSTDDGGERSSRPRPIIVRFHYYQDKEWVLAKRRGELSFRGHRIYIYPDLSTSLARQRAAFSGVKAA